MEHIVQFGITLDDSSIEKLVVEKATEQVKSELIDNITRNMPRKRYYDNTIDWSEAAAEMLQGWFEEHRDELLEMAATKLAEKTFRSKAWKEKYGKAWQESYDKLVEFAEMREQ